MPPVRRRERQRPDFGGRGVACSTIGPTWDAAAAHDSEDLANRSSAPLLVRRGGTHSGHVFDGPFSRGLRCGRADSPSIPRWLSVADMTGMCTPSFDAVCPPWGKSGAQGRRGGGYPHEPVGETVRSPQGVRTPAIMGRSRPRRAPQSLRPFPPSDGDADARCQPHRASSRPAEAAATRRCRSRSGPREHAIWPARTDGFRGVSPRRWLLAAQPGMSNHNRVAVAIGGGARRR